MLSFFSASISCAELPLSEQVARAVVEKREKAEIYTPKKEGDSNTALVNFNIDSDHYTIASDPSKGSLMVWVTKIRGNEAGNVSTFSFFGEEIVLEGNQRKYLFSTNCDYVTIPFLMDFEGEFIERTYVYKKGGVKKFKDYNVNNPRMLPWKSAHDFCQGHLEKIFEFYSK